MTVVFSRVSPDGDVVLVVDFGVRQDASALRTHASGMYTFADLASLATFAEASPKYLHDATAIGTWFVHRFAARHVAYSHLAVALLYRCIKCSM